MVKGDLVLNQDHNGTMVFEKKNFEVFECNSNKLNYLAGVNAEDASITYIFHVLEVNDLVDVVPHIYKSAILK